MSGGMEECAKKEKKTKKMNVKKNVIEPLDSDSFKLCASDVQAFIIMMDKVNEIIERVNKWER